MCHAKVSEDVTHVVSTAQDTDKMHWAKRHNRYRVSINWLFVSGTQNLSFAWQLTSRLLHQTHIPNAYSMHEEA